MGKKDVDAVTQEDDTFLDETQLNAIDKALAIQAPVARSYVEQLRRKHPQWSEEELVRQIEKRFMRLAVFTGVGIGGAAALPGLGTVAAVALTAGEGFAFAEACAFLTLSVAHVRGVDMMDPAARRTVVLAILGGEKGAEIVTKALGKSGIQWSSVLNGVAPDFVVNTVNSQVNRWIRRVIARKVTGAWAGRLVPFGIGAVIGGVGNKVLASSVIEASREVFKHAYEVIEGDSADSAEAV